MRFAGFKYLVVAMAQICGRKGVVFCNAFGTSCGRQAHGQKLESFLAPLPDYAIKLHLWNDCDFLRMTGQFFVNSNVSKRGGLAFYRF